MNYELLKKAGIDIDDALTRFSGNSELLEKYLYKFTDEAVYHNIVTQMDAKNWAAAEDSVHSFKGITGSLAITSLFNTTCELLAELRAKNYDISLQLFEKLKVEYQKTAEIIKKSKE